MPVPARRADRWLQCNASATDHLLCTATVQGDLAAWCHATDQGRRDWRTRQVVPHAIEDIICYFLSVVPYYIGIQPPWATCWALGHSVTTRPSAIKGRMEDRRNQVQLNLEQCHIHNNITLSCAHRVLISGDLNHVNPRVHPTRAY
jgi:hypothetical protein